MTETALGNVAVCRALESFAAECRVAAASHQDSEPERSKRELFEAEAAVRISASVNSCVTINHGQMQMVRSLITQSAREALNTQLIDFAAWAAVVNFVHLCSLTQRR